MLSSIFGIPFTLTMNYSFIFNILGLCSFIVCSLFTIYLILNNKKTTIRQWIIFGLIHLFSLYVAYTLSYPNYIITIEELKHFKLESPEVLEFSFNLSLTYGFCYVFLGEIFLPAIFYYLYNKRTKELSQQIKTIYILIAFIAVSPIILMINYFCEKMLGFNTKTLIIYPYIPLIIITLALIANIYFIIMSNTKKSLPTLNNNLEVNKDNKNKSKSIIKV